MIASLVSFPSSRNEGVAGARRVPYRVVPALGSKRTNSGDDRSGDFRHTAGMAEPHVITGLRAKRAEIIREIDRLQSIIEAHGADLLHIEAALAICLGRRVYEPQRRRRLFQRGEVGRLVFAALRRSERPLSTIEIVALVSPDPERQSRKAALKTIGKSLAKFRQRGDVLGERHGNMTWWRLPE